jgi:uncharacterized heparinase superfamily protein
MRVPDFLLISLLTMGELWRRFVRRVRSGLPYSWRYAGVAPTGLTMSPEDLRSTDPQRAIEFYSGHYSFGAESVFTGGESPFSATPPNQDWFDRLHDFRWLRHHRAADTELARANATALMTDWIELWGHKFHSSAWRSDIIASRLIAWFCHSPLLNRDASRANHRAMLRSIARQTRYLHHNVARTRDGYPRLLATIALAYAALCLAGREKMIIPSARDLDRELIRQILPDGGHISRNPVVLVQILADLLPLKRAYDKHGQLPSAALISAIDRMMGALQFYRHSTGELAQFNGTGSTPSDLMAIVLHYDKTKGAPQNSAPQSGFERLSAGKTVVLMDTGKPLSRVSARKALAGTLSFEMSSGSNRFIANCGVPDVSFDRYAPFTRATAAHSTVTINDTSSSRFANDSALSSLLPSPLIRSPERVSVSRVSDQGGVGLEASHDGYQRKYSIVHDRALTLSEDGSVLSGCDQFLPSGGKVADTTVAALRFHLPAAMTVSMLASGHSILIAAPNKDAWIFTCLDADVALEESIQFSGPDGPRKSEQIVVHVYPARLNLVRWSLEQRPGKPSAQARKQSSSVTDSPGLLDALYQGENQTGA